MGQVAADDAQRPQSDGDQLGTAGVLPQAIDVPAPGGVARFTARAGGVSDGAYASLNLGPWTDDAQESVAANHRIVERAASGGRTLRLARQVHGARVAMLINGAPEPSLDGVDAQVTDRRELVLAALTADCLPVALLAPWGVGVAHAGWRGLAAGVVRQAALALLALPEGGRADEIVAVTGPCARGCCYEVGAEVHAAFAGRPGHAPPQSGSRGTVDLPAIAAAELEGLGVGEIVDTGGCTLHDEHWFSHRASGGTTGRQAGLVWRT